MVNKKNLLIIFSVLVILAISCKGGKKKVVTDDNGRLNIEHTLVLEHIGFDDPQDGIIVKNKDGNAFTYKPIVPVDTLDNLYYANGFLIAQQLQEGLTNFKVNKKEAKLSERELGAFTQGIIDFLAGKEIDENFYIDLDRKLFSLSEDIQKKRAEFAKTYFASLRADKSIKSTKSGLMYKVIAEGDGDKIEYDDAVVNVNYSMNVYDEFEDNKRIEADKADNVEFNISNLIPGAVEGMQLMKVGDEYEFYIIPELGYGDSDVSPTIRANSHLIFRVKVNNIVKKSESGKDNPAEAAADANADADTSSAASGEN